MPPEDGEPTTTTRYGIRYPDGQVAFFGDPTYLTTVKDRHQAVEGHRARLHDLGFLVTPESDIRFVTQDVTTSYGPITEIEETH
jgi:hypothetical protein